MTGHGGRFQLVGGNEMDDGDVVELAVRVRASSDGDALAAVERYLPSNYQVDGVIEDAQAEFVERTWSRQGYGPAWIVLVAGVDVAGWTADDYVIPRLASGLMVAERIGREGLDR